MTFSDRLIIGLTGGIGSGKSAAAARFEQAHVMHVVDADIKSRVVVEPGRPALRIFVARFGDAALLEDGPLKRAALRERVCQVPDARPRLVLLLLAQLREGIVTHLAAARSAYAPLVTLLVVESRQHQMTGRVLVEDL